MRWAVLTSMLVLAWARALDADEITPPASDRFALETEEAPDFQRHVVPLLGRLGCNGRACHGSFQGQGGFRLSLFGYDFASDHEALTGGDRPRVDRQEPLRSLLLQKPTLALEHEGGERFKKENWEHRLLAQWIRNGAEPVRADATLTALEVEPQELVFGAPGETSQLRIVACWSNGDREDVTPLCRFQTNDESVATVDKQGRVTAVSAGDSHIISFYDNGVAAVPVLLPFGKPAPALVTAATTEVDKHIAVKLAKLGLVPSPLCADEEFLRRASLDITGSLPLEEEVLAFRSDAAADKRSRKIDELLERPGYAAWWATQICDWTGNAEANGPVGSEQGLRRKYSEQWYLWVQRRVAENFPYDQIMAGIVLGRSRSPDEDFDAYCAAMSAYFRNDDPADFAARPSMPHFWSRRSLGADEEKARAFAYSFLGVRLECAQCHKHPFDQWTQDDFHGFAAFFEGVRYGAPQRDKWNAMKQAVGLGDLDEDSGAYKRKFVAMLEEGQVLPFKEVSVPAPQKKERPRKPHPRLGRVITPRLLGGGEVLTAEYSDPRQPLVDWLRQPDNPYFARVVVNRVWANYFGRGLVDPSDDLNLANPASNPQLLDYLGAGFVASGYDMKWLHREIATSAAYQRSWRATEQNAADIRNASRFALRRLPAEVLYDAILLATASDKMAAELIHEPSAVLGRAIGLASGYRAQGDTRGYALQLFGKPPREINCDCERSSSPSLQQTLFLQNDDALLELLSRPDGWLAQLVATQTKDGRWLEPDRVIASAYLRALGRSPTELERQTAREYLEEAPPAEGMRDLLWALLNTKEFLVNR